MLRFGVIFIMRTAKTKHLFLTTVFLLIIVFVMGVLIGRHLSSSRVDEITTFIQDNELNTESYLIEQELIENFEQGNCELANARISNLGDDLWELGKKLSPEDAEEKLGVENYNFMKKRYHLMQIRTYILLYQLKQHCNNTDSVVLFYFNRQDKKSEEQGKILDRLVMDYAIHVLAVEHNYSKELEFLEGYYNITETPSVIIDYNTQKSGIVGYEDIEKLIKK